MSGYILSILGIVVAGIIIDIIVPSGTINKYIKSIFSIFVVAIIISPVVKFIANNKDFNLHYNDYEVNEKLMNYIYTRKVDEEEMQIKNRLDDEGFKNIDIIINFSIKDNELNYISCNANIKNMVINADKQHINSYEFIRKIVSEHTNLAYEVIFIDE